jgi:serine/threonine protein kinase
LSGRYRVLDRLGQGGMADVFRAHDELLDRDVAVKVFRTVPQVGDVDTQAELRRELELQSLAQLSHPNLTTLFDGSVSGDGPGYLVLELVRGADLATRLHDGPLPEPVARIVCAQIAEALAYVHAHGMVHRDVKPANILLGEDGRPDSIRARLSDFGIVRMIGSERMTAADLTLGTASYIAPEQARGANAEPPADVYSLGLVMIEALTGVRCFDGPMHEALAARLVSSPAIPPGLPQPWPALLAAMTASDPAQRPSADEVAEALNADAVHTRAVAPVSATQSAPLAVPLVAPFAAAAAPSVAPPADVDDAWYAGEEPPRRRGLWVLTVLALTAIIAGGAYFLMSGNAAQVKTSPSITPAVRHTPSASHVTHHSSAVNVVQPSNTPSHSALRTSHAAAPLPKVSVSHTIAPSTKPAPSPSSSTTPSTSPSPTSSPTGTPAASGAAATP